MNIIKHRQNITLHHIFFPTYELRYFPLLNSLIESLRTALTFCPFARGLKFALHVQCPDQFIMQTKYKGMHIKPPLDRIQIYHVDTIHCYFILIY